MVKAISTPSDKKRAIGNPTLAQTVPSSGVCSKLSAGLFQSKSRSVMPTWLNSPAFMIEKS